VSESSRTLQLAVRSRADATTTTPHFTCLKGHAGGVLMTAITMTTDAAQMVQYMDAMVGRTVNALQRAGVLDEVMMR
jgi:hypothetical protein